MTNIPTKLPTKVHLATALHAIGLDELAENAANGLYDELESHFAEPFAQLTFELGKINTPESCALANDIINGEYEATNEEIDAWFMEPISESDIVANVLLDK